MISGPLHDESDEVLVGLKEMLNPIIKNSLD